MGKLDLTKKYRAVSGNPVEGLHRDPSGLPCLRGLMYDPDFQYYSAYCWQLDGKDLLNYSDLDLEEV